MAPNLCKSPIDRAIYQFALSTYSRGKADLCKRTRRIACLPRGSRGKVDVAFVNTGRSFPVNSRYAFQTAAGFAAGCAYVALVGATGAAYQRAHHRRASAGAQPG